MDFFPTVVTGDVVQVPLGLFLFFLCFTFIVNSLSKLSEHQLIAGILEIDTAYYN